MMFLTLTFRPESTHTNKHFIRSCLFLVPWNFAKPAFYVFYGLGIKTLLHSWERSTNISGSFIFCFLLYLHSVATNVYFHSHLATNLLQRTVSDNSYAWKPQVKSLHVEKISIFEWPKSQAYSYTATYFSTSSGTLVSRNFKFLSRIKISLMPVVCDQKARLSYFAVQSNAWGTIVQVSFCCVISVTDRVKTSFL